MTSPVAGRQLQPGAEMAGGDVQVLPSRHEAQERQAVGAARTEARPAPLHGRGSQRRKESMGERDQSRDASAVVLGVEAGVFLGASRPAPARRCAARGSACPGAAAAGRLRGRC